MTTLKQEWHLLKKGRAGHRFETRYESAKKARKNAEWSDQVGRIFRLFLALGLLAVGVVLVFIPGPAILFFFVGGGLLASESRFIARVLDWTEVKGRALWGWSKRHWKAAPTWGKVVFLILTFACVLVGSWLMLRFVII
jgi:hypothetical protein